MERGGFVPSSPPRGATSPPRSPHRDAADLEEDNETKMTGAFSVVNVTSLRTRLTHLGPEDSMLWAWGQRSLGRLGLGGPVEYATTPKTQSYPIDFLPRMTHRVTPRAPKSKGTKYRSIWKAHNKCDHHCLVVSGEIPHMLRPTPVPLPRGVKLVRIAAGGSHSLALSKDGSLYSWGSGQSAQLGHYKEVQSTPAKPSLEIDKISYVDAGNSHSVAMNGTIHTRST